ncbi:MAG: DUF547 domain-containing protein [Candidatus Omnitrophota bacterium]
MMIGRAGKSALVILTILTIVIFTCPLESRAAVFDHNVFNTLLKKYVSDGKIDYLKWKKDDLETFEEYINTLKEASPEKMSRNGRKAFWINAYNALTIYAVLKRIPGNKLLAKVFSVQMVPGFFDRIKYDVDGESLTLNDIENVKLREGFNDARIHFALVCASRSCPEIQNGAFKAPGLDKKLDEMTRMFIRDKTRNRIDTKDNILYLSQIFKWYEEDFVGDSGSVINYVKKYVDEKDFLYLSSQDVRIKFLYYDWLINVK